MNSSTLQVLHTIYNLAINDQQPLSYQCRPRELILRLLQDWTSIQNELNILQEENLITTKQSETLIINITQKGIDRIEEVNKSTIHS
jgi:hypothetical protein